MTVGYEPEKPVLRDISLRLEERLPEQYDRILVLRDGQLRESGSFRELMAEKGCFYSLYTVANG